MITRRFDLNFIDEIGDQHLACDTGLRVRSVDTIHDVFVFRPRGAIDGNTARLGIASRPGRLSSDRGEVASLGQPFKDLRTHRSGGGAGSHIDDWRLRGHCDRFGDLRDSHCHIDFLRRAKHDLHASDSGPLHSGQRGADRIHAWRNCRESVAARCVGLR